MRKKILKKGKFFFLNNKHNYNGLTNPDMLNIILDIIL